MVDLLASSDLTPSDLAADLGIGSNLTAHHLRILEDAGVVKALRSEGDGRRRYVQLVPATLENLLPGERELASDAVLFVCTGNSARSQLAAALWNASNPVPAESAGTHPAAEVHPLAVAAAREAGLDLGRARPRAIADVDRPPDLVVTVCDRAHEELAGLPRGALVLHWWIPDPRLIGTPAAFADSVRQLRSRIATLSPHVVPTRRRRPNRRTHP